MPGLPGNTVVIASIGKNGKPMLDFTNTPERRKKAAKARMRKTIILLGLAVIVPVAASAFDLHTLSLRTFG